MKTSDALAVLNDLWFDGSAWLKGARLEDRVNRMSTSTFQTELAAALDAWAQSSGEAGRDVVVALADDLLCEQLPESSDYPYFVEGPWGSVDRAVADGVVTKLVGGRPDDVEQRALAVWRARGDRSDATFWRCEHRYATAVALLDAELVLFFLDPG